MQLCNNSELKVKNSRNDGINISSQRPIAPLILQFYSMIISYCQEEGQELLTSGLNVVNTANLCYNNDVFMSEFQLILIKIG